MKLALIVAYAQNRVVGIENRLPWHLPEDLKYFKQVTTGKAVIMGRKTYESIGRPLPNRLNIVISRNPQFIADGVEVVSSLEAAIERATEYNHTNNQDEIMVIGGAAIYELALPLADKLYITLVHAQVDGDAYFPEVSLASWQLLDQQDHQPSEKNPHPYSFMVYQK